MDVDPNRLFRSWLAEHGVTVRKVARAYTHSTADAEDLAQEILLQLWRSLPRFEGRASATTWIYRVALNTALGWVRKERRRNRNRVPIVEEPAEPRQAESCDPLVRRERIDQLYAAIHALPRAEVALVLVYLD